MMVVRCKVLPLRSGDVKLAPTESPLEARFAAGKPAAALGEAGRALLRQGTHCGQGHQQPGMH